MGNTFMRSLVIAAAFMGMSAAYGTEQHESASADVYEEIDLLAGFSVPADRLCQDGQFIYFKDLRACQSSMRSTGPMAHWDCRAYLPIVAINEVEQIFIPEDDSKFINRFYSVKTEYTVAKFKDGVLTGRKTKTMPKCAHRPRLKPTNIFSAREASPTIKYFIQSLLDQGIASINALEGELRYLRMEPTAKRTQFTLNVSARLASVRALIVDTPYCNPTLSKSTIAALMGGDRTGGGVQSFKAELLQSLSAGMEVESPLTLEQWGELTKKPFDPSVKAFDVNCLSASNL